MTAAAYNLDTQWQIPAYVWPAVLGVSVALHVSLFVFGLPNLRWDVTEIAPPPVTEVMFEAGGPVFQEVTALSPDDQAFEPVEPETVVEPTPPLPDVVAAQEPGELTPLEISPVEPVQVSPEAIASDPMPVEPDTLASEVQVVEAEEVEGFVVEEVTTLLPELVEGQTLEAVDVTVPALVSPSEVLVAEEPAVEVSASTGEAEAELSVVTPDVSSADVQDVEILTQAPLAVIETQTLSSAPEVVAEEAPTEVIDTASLEPIVAEPEVALIDPVESAGVVVTQDLVDTQVDTAIAFEAVDDDAQATEILSASPTETVTATSPDDIGVSVITPDRPIALAPIENPISETVTPEIQPLPPVEPDETVVAALSPSEPETSVVPSIAPPTDPANVVPPVEVAAIDPLAKVTRYVQNYDFGDCAHLSVLSAGADSAQVTAFAPGIGPFALFDKRFTSDQGYEASIELRLVTSQQCALLNALGVSEGLDAAGLVELDKTVVKSGSVATGLIQRDLPVARIAAAEAAGLDLGGKGPPELYLIDDAGQIHDGREFLLPASSAQTAGGWRFKVPVVLMSRSDTETALVLAIWNRPAANQPPRFGTLPSSRIAGILAAPGVYSLAAFKVSR
ncbi:hypothetical protein [Roseibium sp.]|uniref:hypothetical protein n=1 Tax=Roseibium sp. TaxID=1936156 RepID=UPI003BAF5311